MDKQEILMMKRGREADKLQKQKVVESIKRLETCEEFIVVTIQNNKTSCMTVTSNPNGMFFLKALAKIASNIVGIASTPDYGKSDG